MPTDPVWCEIYAGLVAVLKTIRKSSDSNYWYDVRNVYETPQNEYDRSRLPAITVMAPVGTSPRIYAGGSNTIDATLVFILEGALRNDPADKLSPFVQMYRLVADIHRALTPDRTLGVHNIRYVRFLQEPAIDPATLTGEADILVFQYPVTVRFSFNDAAP